MLKLRHELEKRFDAETFGRLHTRIVEVEKYIERQLRELGIDLGDGHCKNYLYTKCSSPLEIRFDPCYDF